MVQVDSYGAGLMVRMSVKRRTMRMFWKPRKGEQICEVRAMCGRFYKYLLKTIPYIQNNATLKKGENLCEVEFWEIPTVR